MSDLSQMSSAQRQLWKRIESFSLDDPESRLTFTRRLARENGWSLGYAVRVVDEYKRFAMLAMTACHTVTPSEEVDQAWHLHMVYTRSYWDDFCGETLGRPLHHGPTKGGGAENAKHDDLYRRTLASYQQTFGQAAPADIWPAAEQRFGDDLHWQRVNLARNWVIPKPRFPRLPRWRNKETSSRSPAPLAALGAAPLLLGLENPLDFMGPQFLTFFFVLAIASLVVGWMLRRFLLPEGDPTVTLDMLDPLQLALLNDQGRRRYAQAGLAALAAGEEAAAQIHTPAGNDKADFCVLPRPPRNASATLTRLHKRLTALGTGSLIDTVKQTAEMAKEEEAELQARGLLIQFWWFSASLWGSILPGLTVLLLGGAKISVGMERDKPVAFLIVGCVVLAGILFYVFLRPPRRTRQGERLLQQAIAKHQELAVREPADDRHAEPEMVAMGVALFGTSLLAGGSLALLHDYWPKPQSGWQAGGCTGGCGSGCGGDGGGCGGGGCGGGCGGCGGD